FLANITFIHTGRLTFEVIYPVELCCVNILFYTQEQLKIVNPRSSCWNKQNIIKTEEEQILRLTPTFTWSGCQQVEQKGVSKYICEGGKSF
ncbi:hypothetical protein HELRODRAFT_147546, partial [Helobdella robusta]|uniref:GPR180-like N-terminal domain-containing protein n=1 Tax=Helobdella robusta TaxID=6412 RepID=T1EK12_HELRO